jgi:RNA polymerase sigma factor (sigma-70 family)
MSTAHLGALARHIHAMSGGRRGRERTDRQLLEDFALRRDEGAFAALVGRHGPMVLRVCRRVLGHEQDAEDAFQATFLVLARNARSIHKRESLASWLHGVALRTAMKVRRGAARRRSHEARLQDRRTDLKPVPPAWDDVQAVLDEEVRRLPEALRSAFVLCVLEGKTGPEVAAALGCKEGTVTSWLTRARQRLRERLSRRGITLSALLAVLSTETTSRAALPAVLARTAVRFGLSVAAGEPAATIPTHIAALAAGVTRAMFLNKAKTAVVLILAAGLLIAGATVLARQAPAAGEPPPANQKSEGRTPQTPAAEEKADAVEVRGRVVDPDGKPVSGAAVSLWTIKAKREVRCASEKTGADGRFHITVRGADLPGRATLVAGADGYGLDWVELPHPIPKSHEVTLRLVRDDVPVSGRLLNLEGRGLAGVTVSVRLVEKRADGGDLTAFIATKRQWARGNYVNGPDMKNLGAVALPLVTSVTTDEDGRFRLTGLGRERVAHLTIEGKTIEPIYVEALTRAGPVEGLFSGNENDTVYGATFERVIPPGKAVAGTVREKGTGKPLAGIRVSCGRCAATTDAEGRYRIDGPRKKPEYGVSAFGVPYFDATKNVADTPGFELVKADFELERGLALRGHVFDKVTGKPVEATITYLAFADNPYLKTVSGVGPGGYVRDDGSFAFTGLPGPGVLAVIADGDDYLKVAPDAGWKLVPGINWVPGVAHAFVRIDPSEKDAKSATFDIRLEPAKSVNLSVVGPDDKPLSGYYAAGLTGSARNNFSHMVPRESPTVTVRGLDTRRPRTVVLYSAEKKLGKALVVRGDEADSLRVRLESLGGLTGRILDAAGRPLSGLHVRAAFDRTGDEFDRLPVQFFITRGTWAAKLEGETTTDADGKFCLDGLLPGLKYTLVVSEDGSDDPDRLVIRRDGVAPGGAGGHQDLGDLRSKKD